MDLTNDPRYLTLKGRENALWSKLRQMIRYV
jgi:hypothetical protein